MFKRSYPLTLAAMIAATAAAAPNERVNTQAGAQMLPPPTVDEVKEGAAAIHLPSNLKVPAEWIPLLNRAYEEYWTEGNHRPDAGFVLFARQPSKETAKLWLLRMESKAKNLEQLFALVRDAQDELVKDGLLVDRFNMVHRVPSTAFNQSMPRAAIEEDVWKQVEAYFLYSPTCPHCARLATALVGFPNVHPLQVTPGEVVNWPGLPPSDRADAETVQTYVNQGQGAGGIPVLVLFDRAKQAVMTLRGAHSAPEIMAAAAALQASQQEKRGAFPGPLHPSRLWPEATHQPTGGQKHE